MHSNQYDVTLVQSTPNPTKHTDSRTDINSNSLKYKYKSYGLYYGFELKSYGTRQMSVCLLGKGPSVQLLFLVIFTLVISSISKCVMLTRYLYIAMTPLMLISQN
uniref:Uncharacterized protein n=1 Tax=Cacopsylla melanoneura TaxID=428564 RepID=A0A8D8X369_9HEMI